MAAPGVSRIVVLSVHDQMGIRRAQRVPVSQRPRRFFFSQIALVQGYRRTETNCFVLARSTRRECSSHSISPVNLSSPKRPLPQLLGYPFPYVPLLSPPPAKCSRQLVQCFYFHAQILLFRPSVRKIYTKGCGVSDTVTGTVGEKLGENSNDVCNDTLNRDDVEDPHLPDPNCCRPLTKNGSLCNPTWEQIEAFRQRSARRMTTAASDRCSRWGRASRGPGSSDAT